MAWYNRVTLVGNLTRDPETRQLVGANNATTTIADFGLAVSRKYRTSGGEDREEVLFIDCTAFGKPAETLGQFARKGRLMLIAGRLKLDSWDDKITGAKRSKISVIVENFQFLGRDAAVSEHRPSLGLQQTVARDFTERKNPETPAGQDKPKQTETRSARRRPRSAAPAAVAVNDDDIPF